MMLVEKESACGNQKDMENRNMLAEKEKCVHKRNRKMSVEEKCHGEEKMP